MVVVGLLCTGGEQCTRPNTFSPWVEVERVGCDTQPVTKVHKGRRPAYSCSTPAATCRRPATHPHHLTPALHHLAAGGISPSSGWAVRKNCRRCLASACSGAQQLQPAGTPPPQAAPRRPREAPPPTALHRPPRQAPRSPSETQEGATGGFWTRAVETRHHIARPKTGK